jgi:hypothetical protein
MYATRLDHALQIRFGDPTLAGVLRSMLTDGVPLPPSA